MGFQELSIGIPVTAVTEVLSVGEVRHDTTSHLYDPEHRRHYFPDIYRDEVLIFKTHDADNSRVRGVAHTAFDDPNCSPITPAIQVWELAAWP